MPYETIHIQCNKVHINGSLLEEAYTYYSDTGEDEYFVTGDNRLQIQDSSGLGPIPKDCGCYKD